MELDEDFVEQLKAGQPASYSLLVERFEGPLYRFFLCDHRNHHLAEEQTAETFAQLVRSIPTLRGGAAQLRAFIFSTARHVQLRRWRQRGQLHGVLADAANVRDPHLQPDELVDTREQAERVVEAIQALDDPVRLILFLRFVEDCSIQEISEVMQIPEGTIKSHISRGRVRLIASLTQKVSNR